MSTFILPRDISRRARLVLFAAFTVMDDRGWVPHEGRPPSSLGILRHLCGDVTRSNITNSVKALVAHDLAEVHRIPGPRRGVRVRIKVEGLRVEGQCAVCSSLAHGTGRWCARCKQIFGRDDRAWQVRALELHDQGISPRRISVLLNRPMWAASEEDGRSAHGGAVVPYLLEQGELGPEWAERLRSATRGHVDE